MWALYRIDVFGPYRVELVDILVRRLGVEPCSLHRAKEHLGGPEWFGYGKTESLLSDLLDRTHLLTKAAAQNKARLKDSERVARPMVRQTPARISSRDVNAVTALIAVING